LNDFEPEPPFAPLPLCSHYTSTSSYLHKDFGFVWLRVCPASLGGAFFNNFKNLFDAAQMDL
jgi:hypothetical protein